MIFEDLSERKAARKRPPTRPITTPTGLPTGARRSTRCARPWRPAPRPALRRAAHAHLEPLQDHQRNARPRLGRHAAAPGGGAPACLHARGAHRGADGDDEFMVVLEALADNAADAAVQAQEAAQRIQAGAARALHARRGAWHATVSMGAAIFQGWARAWMTCSSALIWPCTRPRRRGATRCCFFDPRMQVGARHAVRLRRTCAPGLEAGRVRAVLSPEVADGPGRIGAGGAAALEPPERGLVRLRDFIPLAEETGVDPCRWASWVLQAACQQLARSGQQPALAHLDAGRERQPSSSVTSGFRRTGAGRAGGTAAPTRASSSWS